jgi:hypothetical protein
MKTIDRIKIGLGIALLASFAGCVGGYVGVDGGYGGTVVVPVADPYYGGGYYGGGIYERGGDVHGYSHRGSISRAVAHGGGGGVRGGKR